MKSSELPCAGDRLGGRNLSVPLFSGAESESVAGNRELLKGLGLQGKVSRKCSVGLDGP